MAVSGKKISGYRDSLSIGSAEDFEIYCDSCQYIGQSVEAKGFCVNCQENLCAVCLDVHRRTRVSRHHQLLDKAQIVSSKPSTSTDDSKMCTKYCKVHKEETIKFFCPMHDKVGCNDCMTLDHRTCSIDYIPDKCSETRNSMELSDTIEKVADAINEAEVLVKKAQSLKAENETNVADVIKEIEKFQKKLNDKIEHLKLNLVKEANSYNISLNTRVDATADSCVKISSELKQLLTILKDCQDKELDAQAFVTMKHAQSVLNSSNIQKYEHQLTGNKTQIFFEASSEIDSILSQPNGFGKLYINEDYLTKYKKTLQYRDTPVPEVIVIPDKTTVFVDKATHKMGRDVSSFVHKHDINVRTKSDTNVSNITGFAVVSADKLLLADYHNNKLKVVNVDTQSVVEEMTVDSRPWDVTVLPQDQAAVTLSEKKILILGTTEKLKTIRSKQVDRDCFGITYNKDNLFVVCQAPNSLLVLDMRGNIQRDIALQTTEDHPFSMPTYIAVNKNGHRLYISDWKSKFVASLTLHGNISAIYKQQEIDSPQGLVVLEDENLLLCCGTPGTIHYLTTDTKQERTLTRDVRRASSIYYHQGNSQIYVGIWNCDQIKVFMFQ